MVYLKGLQSSYHVGPVRAPELTGGFTYGIERSEALLPVSGGASPQPELPEPYSVRRLWKKVRVWKWEKPLRRK